MIKKSALKAVFETALKLKPSESCLILTDTSKESLAKQFFDYVSKINSKVHFEVMKPLNGHGQEPLPQIADLMKRFDVELLITSFSLTHTKARRDANKAGARIASMPLLTEEISNRCLDVDFKEVNDVCERLQGVLQNSKTVRVTSGSGTDIIFQLGNRKIFSTPGLIHSKGAVNNLPDGEVEFSPVSASGRYVVDGSLVGFEKSKLPLIFDVGDGTVTNISGKHALEFKEILNKIGPKAYVVAELGIGTNPKAIVTGNILEDEKSLGTCHIAVGNNLSYGGFNDVPLHLDGLILKPTIFADEEMVMKNGKLLL
ncbi:MAG: aminopeptidase [archaeon]|jgi:leucyl aminopeptidase (aminopeptidase T)